MKIINRLISFLDKLSGRMITRFKYKKNLDIDPSARLESSFAVNFLTKTEDRTYIKVGQRCLVAAKLTFESYDGYVEIGNHAFVGAIDIICRNKVVIGNNVTIAWGVTIYDHNSHSLDYRQRMKVVEHFFNCYGEADCYENIDWTDVSSAPIYIEDHAWIGFDATILKGVRIGKGAIVAAKSVVTRDVAPFTVVAGNPAVVVKHLNQER